MGIEDGPKPSVGRIVHRTGHYPGECLAAIVTATGPEVDMVSLCILDHDGVRFERNVRQEEHQKGPGTWHWPERV